MTEVTIPSSRRTVAPLEPDVYMVLRMPIRLSLLAVVLLAVATAPAAAQAKTAVLVKVGPAHGSHVTLTVTRHTRQAYRGKTIAVDCGEAPKPSGSGIVSSGSSGESMRVSAQPLYAVGDYCRVHVRLHSERHSDPQQVFIITKAGRAYVDRVARASVLSAFSIFALKDGTFPPAAEMAKQITSAKRPVEAIAAPTGTVAEGHIGIWTDGVHRFHATATVGGAVLFLDLDIKTNVISTNVLSELLAPEQDAPLAALLNSPLGLAR
jgi:hypothetical protein